MSSKAKGSRGERNAAKYLMSLGYTARRSQQYSGQSEESQDLLHNIPNIRLEIKNGYNKLWLEHKDVIAWLDTLDQEIAFHGKPTTKGLVLWKTSYRPWLAVWRENGIIYSSHAVPQIIAMLSK